MAPNRFTRIHAVLLASSLVATSSAIDFGGEGDISQTAGTVSPGGDTATASGGGFENQWAQTASSSNSVPLTAPSGSGYQGWSQPATTDSPSAWTAPSGQTSRTEDQGWPHQTGLTSTASSGAWTTASGEPSGFGGQGEMSLECSGSDDEFNPGSLECSGSDEEQVSTSTEGPSNITPTTTTAPNGDVNQSPSSMASSSNTPTSAATGEYESSPPITSSAVSTTSSGIGNEEDSSQTAQISSSPATSTSGAGEQASSTTTQTSSNRTGSGDHATFGTITSGSDKCVVGDPDTYISAKDLEWIWENRMKAEVTAYDNWILDHLVANKGSINYCVRWDSDKKLDKEIASKFQDMLSRQHAAWNHWLVGYNCWPHDEIKVNVVGFAVKDKSLLGWSDDSLGTIYAGDLDKDGSPQCPTKCYRSYNDGATDGWSESSGCTGEPFDISLWPKQGLGGGWGTYWGQQVNLDNMLEHLDDQELEIVSHEMGHGFGLPDFYQEPKPANFKPCLMDALTSSTVRDTDGWMLRRVLESKKTNYNF